MPIRSETNSSRRNVLVAALSVGGSLWLSACGSASAHAKSAEGESQGEKDEDITPTEDLMREHGVLRRVLLVYENAAERLEKNQPLPQETLTAGASLIRTFVEQYHELLEEQYLFPRFEKAGQQAELVATLRLQHQTGRDLTRRIEALSRQSLSPAQRPELVSYLRAYIRMYQPHAAREDTVLFPALRKLIGEHELKELGEKFESIEHQRFGKEGFENCVRQVDSLEQQLGIESLALFTPKLAALR